MVADRCLVPLQKVLGRYLKRYYRPCQFVAIVYSADFHRSEAIESVETDIENKPTSEILKENTRRGLTDIAPPKKKGRKIDK